MRDQHDCDLGVKSLELDIVAEVGLMMDILQIDAAIFVFPPSRQQLGT